MQESFAEIQLFGPRGNLIRTVKAKVESVVISREPIEVEPELRWRRFEEAREVHWSLHLIEDTKRGEDTRFCGDHKDHGFHRYADRYWCDGVSAIQQATKQMIESVMLHLSLENVPSDIISRVRNRLIFGDPQGGRWISAEHMMRSFSDDQNHKTEMMRLTRELMELGEKDKPDEQA